MTISGELGGLKIPVAAPVGKSPFPSPTLDTLGAYLKAVLTAYAGTAWQQVAPNEPIVRGFYTHDPEQYDFNAKHLPAIYLWPEESVPQPQQAAEDWQVRRQTIRVVWVLPPADQFKQGLRSRALPLIGDLIDRKLYEGRDPSWVKVGDPDLTAPFEGSVVLRHAGLTKMEGGRWRPGQIAIRRLAKTEDPTSHLFDCLDMQVIVEKRSQQFLAGDPDLFGSGSGLTSPAQLDVSINGGQAEALFLVGYTMLYVQNGTVSQTLGTTPAKLTCFTGQGQAAGVVADHANDRITVENLGPYNVNVAFSVQGTPGREVFIRAYKNGVAVDGAPGRVTLTSGTAVVALCPQFTCAAGDALELYAEADQAGTEFTVVAGTFSVTRI